MKHPSSDIRQQEYHCVSLPETRKSAILVSLDAGGVWAFIYCILVDIMTGYYLPQCVCNGSTAGSQTSHSQSADKQICRVLQSRRDESTKNC